jgi:hypothetical protein
MRLQTNKPASCWKCNNEKAREEHKHLTKEQLLQCQMLREREHWRHQRNIPLSWHSYLKLRYYPHYPLYCASETNLDLGIDNTIE